MSDKLFEEVQEDPKKNEKIVLLEKLKEFKLNETN